MDYLDFEQPIAEILAHIEELKKVSTNIGDSLDFTDQIESMKKKQEELTTKIFSNLGAWQISQLSRHPLRPYTLDYIENIFTDFEEFHGDRAYADDNGYQFTPEAVEGLKRYPAIFADKNHSYGKTDDAQDAYLGFVKDVKIQDNGIKIYYTIITAIPQQILNEQCFEFGICGARSFNELNRTHWALKQINLIEALQKAGVQII
nr:hypothetical protein [uncultured Ruminobacter sp.]